MGGKTQIKCSQMKNDGKECLYIASYCSPNRTTKAYSWAETKMAARLEPLGCPALGGREEMTKKKEKNE